MTDKREKIVSGRFELVTDGFGRKYLFLPNKDKGYSEKIGPASWSEFLELSKEILRHEDSYKHDIERNVAIDHQRER